MTDPLPPLALAALICAIAYLPLTGKPPGRLRSGLKTSAVALLAISAALSGAPPLLSIALALCALGDYLLARETETGFMAGVGAFATGHIAYAALFLSLPGSDPALLFTGLRLVVVIGLIALGLVMARVLGTRAGDLAGPVLAYIPIILGMGFAAATLPALPVLIAALTFIASDFILAVDKFLMPADHPVRRWAGYSVWVLYWGAQFGFYAGLT